MQEETSPPTPAAQPSASRSRLMGFLRLVPITLMLLVLVALCVAMLLGGMARIAGWYLLQIVPPLLGLLSLLLLALYALIKRKASRLLLFTAGVGLVSLLPLILWFVPVAFPASLESTTPAATVRLPADVPLRVGWGGDSIATNYHAATPDQRWAYDLLVEPYLTGSEDVQAYGCYGVPVVAPAAGLVTQTHDGEPDEVPGAVSNNFTAPTGNHVVIQLESGTYLVIAHLKPGSVSVQAGEQVEEGQVIGQCGNSGNTSEPHIHIHHQRQDPAIFPLNFAEGLPLYFRDHDGAPMPQGGLRVEGESVTPIGDVVQHTGG
ncbi:MAG: M23 family metallopeptidase [Caldilineaceae bacterium]|nr:M23 family metallopeptidase [Caldilineaceae bacterium]